MEHTWAQVGGGSVPVWKVLPLEKLIKKRENK